MLEWSGQHLNGVYVKEDKSSEATFSQDNKT